MFFFLISSFRFCSLLFSFSDVQFFLVMYFNLLLYLQSHFLDVLLSNLIHLYDIPLTKYETPVTGNTQREGEGEGRGEERVKEE